jgi:AcrR family transcriptional regulator
MVQLREERKSKWNSLMKEGLHQAVVKVLAEQGLAGLTMERVAKEAGIAKGTLYLYFQDKEELLQSAVQSSMEPLEQELDKILDSELSPNRKLEAIVQQSLSYFEANRNFFRVFLNPEFTGPRMNREGKDRHRRLVAKVAQVFKEGVERGHFRPLPDLKAAGVFVMGCAAMIQARLWEETPPPLVEDVQLFLNIFFKGVLEEGVKR